ncbi:MAG: single-stranded DNA-specific DHH superfamily exonuclease [Paraglaciecola sp.]|jgi:single-stranded DNA-specific DHH superfamily exonuclease
MANYDLFNGDADGICALIQLRLAHPKESTLITGIKRDIKLLKNLTEQVELQQGDEVVVLDVSMAKNTEYLNKALNAGANVFYADHHQMGDKPEHENLDAHINTASNTCTALIVNAYLKAQLKKESHAWAIVAAFGDNITIVAEALCDKAGYNDEQINQLRTLGVCMNYNGYGADLDDLFYHPAKLYKIAVKYDSPFEFIENETEVFNTLFNGYGDDMARALQIEPDHESETAAMFILPNEKWARRVSGVVGNELANQFPDRAHAILTEREEKIDNEITYQVSIRAPKNNPVGADVIANKFCGGGRKAAAGINLLINAELHLLSDKLESEYTHIIRKIK